MSHLPIAIAVAVLGIAVGYFLLSRLGFLRPSQFKRKRLMTSNELEFFQRIRAAVPEFYIFPQVALRAFIEPPAARGSSAFMRQLKFIGSKHCDYLICDSNLSIVGIIELDDRSHNASLDAIRDKMTKSVGVSTLRYESARRPNPAKIRSDLLGLLQGSGV
ncbi:DUF2726 domain-containing protein [Azonexus hydrophilus]|uniref:DUF2726 domain-containing protein n=1 Tax=Azonexus hydrophilus TaxID=418702 RepID=A0ABZ2XLR8_9RHOO